MFRLTAGCVLAMALAWSSTASAGLDGGPDYQTDAHNYYYIVTGGVQPAWQTYNGDNASGGVFRFLTDDPAWGQPTGSWQKDDWFTDNAGFALTLKNGGTTVYQNHGIEQGDPQGYYNGDGPHGNHGLYRGYSMSNNFDWTYASYFNLDPSAGPVTFDTIIGYFDGNGYQSARSPIRSGQSQHRLPDEHLVGGARCRRRHDARDHGFRGRRLLDRYRVGNLHLERHGRRAKLAVGVGQQHGPDLPPGVPPGHTHDAFPGHGILLQP